MDNIENTEDKQLTVEWPVSGWESIKGRRTSMEDAHVCIDDIQKETEFSEIPTTQKHSIYGVYDGHGGAEAALLVEKILHKNIVNDNKFNNGEYEESIKNGFMITDKQVIETSCQEGWSSGTTVVFTVITNNKIYLGNVGDSEAVLGRRTTNGYEAILISQKQKPTDNDEKERIKKAGGHVVFGRVMGTLAVSRAIGDKDFKHPFNKGDGDFVTAIPFINTIDVQENDEFLIIACDGLWDKFTYQNAVDYIALERQRNHSPSISAKNIVKCSLERGSLDNITTIVIYLKSHVSLPSLVEQLKQLEIEAKEFEELNNNEEEEIEEDKGELIDVFEFLKREGELHMARSHAGSPKARKCFALFKNKLPENEYIQEEYVCSLESTILYNGLLMITQNYICFYSNAFGRKIQKQIVVSEIESIKKHKSLVIMNAITVETNGSRKYTFNWRQNQIARDTAFKKILELLNGPLVTVISNDEQSLHKYPIPANNTNNTSTTTTTTTNNNNTINTTNNVTSDDNKNNNNNNNNNKTNETMNEETIILTHSTNGAEVTSTTARRQRNTMTENNKVVPLTLIQSEDNDTKKEVQDKQESDDVKNENKEESSSKGNNDEDSNKEENIDEKSETIKQNDVESNNDKMIDEGNEIQKEESTENVEEEKITSKNEEQTETSNSDLL